MAFASLGTVGSGQSKTSASSIAMTTATTALSVGHLCVVFVAKDNSSAVYAETNEVTSVTDSVGNTYTKAHERCFGDIGVGNGATHAIWYSVLTVALPTASTITANFVSAVTAKAISAWGYSKGSGTTVSVDGAISGSSGNGLNGSAASTVTCSTNVEHLAMRTGGIEAGATPTATVTDWTAITATGTTGGGGTTNMSVFGLWKIEPASTSITCQPTNSTSGDCAIVFVAFKETAGGGPSRTPSGHVFIIG